MPLFKDGPYVINLNDKQTKGMRFHCLLTETQLYMPGYLWD